MDSLEQPRPEDGLDQELVVHRPDAIRAADFNLSAGRYRPQSQTKVDHRDPLEVLDELKAIETEILEEIDDLAVAVREAVER